MEKRKNSAVDLTELAIGIVVLGIVVAIGAVVLLNLRDSRLTSLDTVTTANETVTPGFTTGVDVANFWVSGVGDVTNSSVNGAGAGGELIDPSNYTFTISDGGVGHIVLNSTSSYANESVNVTYTWFNTSSNADWGLANDAATGLAEYGNWFTILVIVGIAAVVLGLIFLAFGRRSEAGGVSF